MQELYQKKLLRLAANATGEGRMPDPDAEGTLDNPTCGDRITIQIKMDGDKITALNHENRSCMLCQASASVLGEHAVGKRLPDILSVREEIEKMLLQSDVSPALAWDNLKTFAPVAGHPSRHTCVLLPFDALISVMSKVKVDS
ncbi:MAG: hypothetical protein COB93_04690 [Sneathiella sp.]|nr:MAG: hypothetical protein COB93_04690 [Sneathiella sp.]